MQHVHLPFGQTADDFRWCTGIEDTFVPQTRPGLRALDEYALMGHYERWREDLALAKSTGAQMIRWGIPWYRVEPSPGCFDWSWTDKVFAYLLDELQLEPIVDLMHYGTPLWLEQSFASPRYPDAVAAYARAVVERYGDRLRYYTPLNEPIMNATMCGWRGVWPPYLRGERGYVRLALQLAQGIVKTVRVIQQCDPAAIMVHVEAASITRAAQPELAVVAETYRNRGYLFFDLITGRVNTEHPLFAWLLTNNGSLHELHWLAEHAIGVDMMGINFYPQWSTSELYLDRAGRLKSRVVEREGRGFRELVASFFNRYRAPIMITETSMMRSSRGRRRWLDESVAAVRDLRAMGVPVLGYTWFPLFTMVDWKYRTGRGPVDDYLVELGLFESRRDADGNRRYVATELAERFRRMTENPELFVGDLAVEPSMSLA